MKPIHPYAHILRAIADGKTIQLRDDTDTWHDIAHDRVLMMIGTGTYEQQGIRVKPLIINGYEISEPLRTAPDRGSEYWVADPGAEELAHGPLSWDDDDIDVRYLERGLAHDTEEAAITHVRALLSFTTTV